MVEPKAEPKVEPKEAKPEPKSVEPPDPASLSELARAMAAGSPEVTKEGSDGEPASPEPKAASKEKEGDKPPTSQEKPKVKGDEPEPKDGQESPEDFLKRLDFTKPEEAIKALLGHPEFGGKLQSWSDGAVAAQVKAAQERDRPGIEASEREKAQIQAEDEHFASMSDEEVVEEIGKDKKAAAAYARYQARQQQGAEPDAEGVAAASTVYALVAQIHLNTVAVEESKLPAEKKTELAGKNFSQQGQDGIHVWSQAIQTALVEQAAEVRAQELLGEKWETFKEERQAEEDPERPPVVRGSRTPPVPDLLEGDSASQMEEALAHQEKK